MTYMYIYIYTYLENIFQTTKQFFRFLQVLWSHAFRILPKIDPRVGQVGQSLVPGSQSGPNSEGPSGHRGKVELHLFCFSTQLLQTSDSFEQLLVELVELVIGSPHGVIVEKGNMAGRKILQITEVSSWENPIWRICIDKFDCRRVFLDSFSFIQYC